MADMFWTVRHVESRENLPEKLERGRAYFVDDEQYIVIDFGRGPVIYGGKPGPAGAAGEPNESMQGQIQHLAEASVRLSGVVKKVNDMRIRDVKNLTKKHEADIESLTEKHNEDIEALTEKHDTELQALTEKHDTELQALSEQTEENLYQTSEDLQKLMNASESDLREMIHNNSLALTTIVRFCYHKFSQIDKAISIVVKLLTSLYPNADIDTEFEADEGEQAPKKLTAGEILITDSVRYKVKNSYTNSDGSVVVILDVLDDLTQEYVKTLNEGDTFESSDGYKWKVVSNDVVDGEGTILLTNQNVPAVIETLEQGSTVSFDGKTYKVESAVLENGHGTISLVLSE